MESITPVTEGRSLHLTTFEPLPTTTMQIKITKNPTFGQLYLKTSDGQDLRIPRQSVDDFFEALEENALGNSWMGLPATRIGPIAEDIWDLAQQYEG